MEVMIAAFVLSVGLLGSTAMMLRGQQEASKINYEAIAFQLATNMAERMRGNITGVDSGVYNGLTADAAATMDCSTLCANPADVASYHAYIWGQELEDLMPSHTSPTGRVDVVGAGGADSVYNITVSWTGAVRTSTDTQSQTTKSYVMMFQP